MVNRVNKSAFFKKIGYTPHAGQILFHNSMARFRLANCGRRFGKSAMVARDAEPKLMLKNKNIWIVAPTYDLGEKEFRVIWNDLILGQRLGQNKEVSKAYNKKQGNMYIKFPWGTILEVRTADHPENLVGDDLFHVIMSEAAKHRKDTWDQYIRPALADSHGTADFATTPEGFNWLYEVWMLGKDDRFPDYESWKFPSWMNPHVFPGGEQDPEILSMKGTMPEDAFNQEIKADFGSFVGKIYHEWDPTVHCANLQFNPAWPNFIAFDWGFTNPLAAIEFQISPDDKIYIWREHYKSYMRVERHCEELKRRTNPAGYHLELCFGDAADPDATLTVNEKFAPCLSLPEAKENWRQGIDLVSGFLNRECDQDEHGGPIYEPALFVDHSCINTIKEFNNYKAPPGVGGKNAAEIGFKQNDHALDAIRYGLVHIYEFGANRHLAEVMDFGEYRSPFAAMQRNSGAAGIENPQKQLVVANSMPGTLTLADFGADDVASGYFTTGVNF